MGLIKKKNGAEEILLVGGWYDGDYKDTSLRFDLESMLWLPGPSIPVEIENMASVQKDGTLIINGGHFGNRIFYDGILEYDPEGEKWIEHSGTLEHGRSIHQSVLVPSGYFPCD